MLTAVSYHCGQGADYRLYDDFYSSNTLRSSNSFRLRVCVYKRGNAIRQHQHPCSQALHFPEEGGHIKGQDLADSKPLTCCPELHLPHGPHASSPAPLPVALSTMRGDSVHSVQGWILSSAWHTPGAPWILGSTRIAMGNSSGLAKPRSFCPH